MKTIIDFVLDASEDPTLTKNFTNELTNAKSYEDLISFFKNNKYNVSDDECIRILENKDKLLIADLSNKY